MPGPHPEASRDDEVVFRDAEAWLAQRGVRREPIVVAPPPDVQPDAPVGVREAARLAQEHAHQAASSPQPDRRDDPDSADSARPREDQPEAPRGRLEDDIAAALAFVRRSTSVAPQAEARLRAKLSERGWPAVVVDGALDRARRQGLVDDPAMVAALIEERRARGHAPARIRKDLTARGFDADLLDRALAATKDEDPEAAAFAVAQDRAEWLTGVPAETAYRRVVGYIVRRGYPEGLARKVAREAVFTTRDSERTAGQ